MGGVGIARAQHRGQGKAAAAVEDEERVVHVLFVIPMEKAELLFAMGGVVGGVHVEDDHLAGAGMGLEVQVQEPVGESAQVLGADPVLKPGQGGLGGQVAGTFRSFAGHDLQGRVPGQGGGVVVVFVTLGNGEQPLPHQGQEIMPHLAVLAGVVQARGSLLGESIALVQLPQQQTAGIGGDPATFKIGDDLLAEKASKVELFMADCIHRVSCLRSCLSGDFSILADTLPYFKNYS